MTEQTRPDQSEPDPINDLRKIAKNAALVGRVKLDALEKCSGLMNIVEAAMSNMPGASENMESRDKARLIHFMLEYLANVELKRERTWSNRIKLAGCDVLGLTLQVWTVEEIEAFAESKELVNIIPRKKLGARRLGLTWEAFRKPPGKNRAAQLGIDEGPKIEDTCLAAVAQGLYDLVDDSEFGSCIQRKAHLDTAAQNEKVAANNLENPPTAPDRSSSERATSQEADIPAEVDVSRKSSEDASGQIPSTARSYPQSPNSTATVIKQSHRLIRDHPRLSMFIAVFALNALLAAIVYFNQASKDENPSADPTHASTESPSQGTLPSELPLILGPNTENSPNDADGTSWTWDFSPSSGHHRTVVEFRPIDVSNSFPGMGFSAHLEMQASQPQACKNTSVHWRLYFNNDQKPQQDGFVTLDHPIPVSGPPIGLDRVSSIRLSAEAQGSCPGMKFVVRSAMLVRSK